MVQPSLVYGTFLLVVGAVGAVYPYRVARLGERIDAIGSRRSWFEVEPADWMVTLTRVIGAVAAVFGGIMWVAYLLAP